MACIYYLTSSSSCWFFEDLIISERWESTVLRGVLHYLEKMNSSLPCFQHFNEIFFKGFQENGKNLLKTIFYFQFFMKNNRLKNMKERVKKRKDPASIYCGHTDVTIDML